MRNMNFIGSLFQYKIFKIILCTHATERHDEVHGSPELFDAEISVGSLVLGGSG